MVFTATVSKKLSKNDAGAHSSKEHGILIPKHPDFQSFFPSLDVTLENPKTTFGCIDQSTGRTYDLNYTFYNKTKNEYRLTRARKFLQERGAQEGSQLSISKDASGTFFIDLIQDGGELHTPDLQTTNDPFDRFLTRVSGWTLRHRRP